MFLYDMDFLVNHMNSKYLTLALRMIKRAIGIVKVIPDLEVYKNTLLNKLKFGRAP